MSYEDQDFNYDYVQIIVSVLLQGREGKTNKILFMDKQIK